MNLASAARQTRSAIEPSVGSATDDLCVQIPPSAFTWGGFRSWATSGKLPERLRVAFIDGEIYLDMSNEEPETHVAVKAEVTRAIMTLNLELRLGKFYPDGVLVSNKAAKVSNNPDAVFLGRRALKTGRVRLVRRRGTDGPYKEIVGTPDWVLEVISDSSVTKDTRDLLRDYHRAGIPEYWIIDARGGELLFVIHHWRKARYVAAPSEKGWQASQVFPRQFRLKRHTDEWGLWEYTLEVREE